jgi:type I restriction enzyme S subunit
MARLGGLAAFRTGPFGSALHQSDYVEDGVPVVNPMQIVDGAIRPTSSMTVSESAARKLSDFRLAAGNVVIARRGGMGRCAYVDDEANGWLCGTGSMVIRTGPLMDPRFLQRVLSSAPTVAALEAASVGSTMVNLNQGTLANLHIPLPPKPEQEAIARALNDADALVESLEQLLAKKRHLKQGAMQELLTGKKRLPGFTEPWEQRSLGDLCVKIQDGTHFSPKMGGNDFLYVTSKNIRPGKLDVSSAGRISAAEHAKIYARCDVAKGDLLLTKDGANTGNAALNTTSEPFSLLSSVAMLRFDSRRHVAQYFLYQVHAYEGQQQIAEMMSGNAITRLTLTKIRLLRFPVPSLAEQSAIAEILGDMDQEIDTLEAKLTKARQIKQGMMQELLTGRIRLV